MADQRQAHEAMVIPRGARIIASDGSEIALDVQGDLILQESQRGLTSLVSHHGSILIDENVTVRSHSIKAKHMIRVRGRLETQEIKAATISLENGTLSSVDLVTERLEAQNSQIDIRAIKAQQVKIEGGRVEIGSIISDSLKLGKKVRGAILISNSTSREMDDTVQIKGGFESDVELLGYLLKYRRQVMSDRVLHELKSRADGREFQKLLIQEAQGADAAEPLDELGAVDDLPADELPEEDARETEESGEEVRARLKEFSEDLKSALPLDNTMPTVLKLLVSTLRQGDIRTLKTMFQRWAKSLEGERGQLSVEAQRILTDLQGYVDAH